MRILKQSYIQFVYAFTFDTSEFEGRSQKFDGKNWESSWDVLRFNLPELLDHVLDLDDTGSHPSDFRSWELRNEVVKEWSGHGAKWVLNFRKTSLEFEFQKVSLCLFNTGYGFIVVNARPNSDVFNDWLDFLHFFRFKSGNRDVTIAGKRIVPVGVSGATPFEFKGKLSDKIVQLLKSDIDHEPWWKPAFSKHRLIPFFCVLAEDCSPEFALKEVYQLRSQFHSQQPCIPSSLDVSKEHRGMIEYAENQFFILSLEGGGYYSRNPPDHPFFLNTMCEHIRGHYLLMFLIVLHQRIHISNVTRKVAQSWIEQSDDIKHAAFEDLKATELWYAARFQFGLISHVDHHQDFYERWQEIFRVRQGYEEIKDKVKEMQLTLQERQNRSIENRINLFGALLGLPALTASIMALNLKELNTPDGWSATTALSFVGGSFLVGLVWFFLFLRR